ncbi:MAG: cardiolipin synthase ClsB [Gemmatimonadota bacterium]
MSRAPRFVEPLHEGGRSFGLVPKPVVFAGNRMQLLVTGEEYFPALLAAIEDARVSIHLETYIYADDNIGHRVTDALAAAASRGVQVRVLIDGFGGGDYARRLVGELGAQGAEVRIFRPERWWRLERKLLRRLHRKIAVIDDRIAFVGGINIIDDHNVPPSERGRIGPRFDFAVACEGPIVAPVALAVRQLWWILSIVRSTAATGPRPRIDTQPRVAAIPGGVAASFLLRDNLRHRRTIERAYLEAIGAAREEIVLASAYFLPGRRVRAALLDAVRRGVRVRLLLQGRVEYAIQHYAERALFGQLLAGGIEIYEYRPAYLHAKVGVVDGRWATVGSSNIDPYSLLLAREANVVVHDTRFAQRLEAVLLQAIERDADRVRPEVYARRGLFERAFNWIAFGVVRLATVVLARGLNY